jgi:hypothetical protein
VPARKVIIIVRFISLFLDHTANADIAECRALDESKPDETTQKPKISQKSKWLDRQNNGLN